MNAAETGNLIALMALYDNRKTGDAEIVAWLKTIGDLRYADCEAAVVAHYRESRERVMPADVRTRVEAIRRQRIEDAEIPAPPEELRFEPEKYRAWLREVTRRIADGEDPAAIEGRHLRSLGPAS